MAECDTARILRLLHRVKAYQHWYIAAILPQYAVHCRLLFYYTAKPKVELRLYTFQTTEITPVLT